MKNWKEERNYRTVKNENGDITAYIITVDEQDVEVTKEVYLAYSQMDRRERYLEEQKLNNDDISLECFEENNVPIDCYAQRHAASAEETYMDEVEDAILEQRRQALHSAMTALSDEDKQLIEALYIAGVSTREYAKAIGRSKTAVINRRDRILRRLCAVITESE